METEPLSLVFYLVVLAVILFFVIRGSAHKARRKRAEAEIREYWAEEAPGEILSKCPMCRFPYPVSQETCPFCDRSRRRARMLRRDSDWRKETSSGYHYLG